MPSHALWPRAVSDPPTRYLVAPERGSTRPGLWSMCAHHQGTTPQCCLAPGPVGWPQTWQDRVFLEPPKSRPECTVCRLGSVHRGCWWKISTYDKPRDMFPHILHVLPGRREAEWCRERPGGLETGVLAAVPTLQGRFSAARFEPWQLTLPVTGPPWGSGRGYTLLGPLGTSRGLEPQGADPPADPARWVPGCEPGSWTPSASGPWRPQGVSMVSCVVTSGWGITCGFWGCGSRAPQARTHACVSTCRYRSRVRPHVHSHRARTLTAPLHVNGHAQHMGQPHVQRGPPSCRAAHSNPIGRALCSVERD